jgi:transposase-like protein
MTKDQRIKIVENYRASGMTIRCFSRQENISEQSLRNWIKRNDVNVNELPEPKPGFVEVKSSTKNPRIPPGRNFDDAVPRQSKGLGIRFPGGAVIEVYPDTDHRVLQWVLDLMGSLV